jgi:hypothetical protein
MALFQWLNSWQCRQFARRDHATVASPSLVAWADRWFHRLPGSDEHLTNLAANDIRTLAAAYADLKVSPASRQALPSGRSVVKGYGPTGAIKTLFALRPLAVPPWDDAIRQRLGYDGSGESLERYLLDVARQLRGLAAEAGVDVGRLPAIVGRPSSPPPKLIDEYNFVAYTKGVPIPPRLG